MPCMRRPTPTCGGWLARGCARAAGRPCSTPARSCTSRIIRFAEARHLRLEDRVHFMRWAARVMRSVIVDFARRRLASRRGGGAARVTLDVEQAAAAAAGEERDPGRAPGAGPHRRSRSTPDPGRGDAVLRRHDGARDCAGARRDGTHGPTRLAEGAPAAARSAGVSPEHVRARHRQRGMGRAERPAGRGARAAAATTAHAGSTRSPPEHDAIRPRLRRLLSDAGPADASAFLQTIPKVDAGSGTAAGRATTRAPAGDRSALPRRAQAGRRRDGAVWLADRADGMVNRPVALKLPRGAWRAPDSPNGWPRSARSWPR